MIQQLRKDVRRLLINYLLPLFLTAFGRQNFSFVYWNRISASACMTPSCPLDHKRNLTSLSSASLGNWGKEIYQATCYNYIRKLWHCLQ